MSQYSTEFLCRSTSGRLLRGRHEMFDGVSIDSRSLTQGNAFFCIRGPRFDGHQFASQAVERGAVALVIDNEAQSMFDTHLIDYDGPVVVVDDTVAALGALATAVRRQVDVTLVGLTGSSGKTTTKAFVAAVLARSGPTLATEGNLNNHLGVPLTLMRLTENHRFAVVEMGMNAPGEIDYLARLARPNLGIVTTIGAAHLEGVGDLAGVAQAKGELFTALPEDAWAIYPSSVVERETLIDGLKARSMTVGQSPDDAIRILHVQSAQDGSIADVCIDGTNYKVTVGLPGLYNVHNALLALAVAHALGLDLNTAIESIKAVSPLPLRSEWRVSPAGVSILLDCYNANPQSMAAALEHFTTTYPSGVVVLGDMLELGPTAQQAHHEIGDWLANHASSVHLVAIGELGQEIAHGALEAGLPKTQVTSCVRIEDAYEAIDVHHLARRTMMIKGSRGARLERCWYRITSSEEA